MPKETKPKWRHSAETTGVSFGLFYPSEDTFDFPHGPFNTWAECKADAIAYFKCDLDDAKRQIRALRKLTKKQALAQGEPNA